MPAYRVLERVYSLAKGYSRFDCTNIFGRLSIVLSFWALLGYFRNDLEDSFHSIGALILELCKINFDGSMRDSRDGMGYVIRDLDGRLLVVGGSSLFELSIPGARFCTARAGIICAR